MRNMSFSIKTKQFIEQTADVTRRMGWQFLTPKDRVMGVEKAQGLKKGQKVNRLGEIVIVSVRREPLNWMTLDPDYGWAEVVREGFPHFTPAQFVEMYCDHNKCEPTAEITRIEYAYADPIVRDGIPHFSLLALPGYGRPLDTNSVYWTHSQKDVPDFIPARRDVDALAAGLLATVVGNILRVAYESSEDVVMVDADPTQNGKIEYYRIMPGVWSGRTVVDGKRRVFMQASFTFIPVVVDNDSGQLVEKYE